MKGRGLWLLRGLGLVVLAWLFGRTDWDNVGRAFLGVNLSYLYILPPLTLIMVALRSWRWMLLLKADQIAMKPLRALSLYATGLFLGSFTPGRMGDMAKALYLRREFGLPWTRALSGTVLDRLFDLALLLALGCWAVGQLGLWNWAWPWAGAGLGAGVLFAILYLCFPNLSGWDRLKQHQIWEFIQRCRGDIAAQVQSVGITALALTILAYLVYFAQTALLARALGIGLAVADIAAAIALVGLAAFLPVSVAGLGTREGLLFLVFSHRGLPDSLELAMAYSGFFLVFCFLLPALVGALCWMRDPLPAVKSIDDIN